MSSDLKNSENGVANGGYQGGVPTQRAVTREYLDAVIVVSTIRTPVPRFLGLAVCYADRCYKATGMISLALGVQPA